MSKQEKYCLLIIFISNMAIEKPFLFCFIGIKCLILETKSNFVKKTTF